MRILEAIVLGIVQGVAEFLPVSSSGHLVIVTAILQSAAGRDFDPEHDLHMNIAVHVGTLLSIVWVYRRDLRPVVGDLRLIANVVLATVPIVGLVLLLGEGVRAAFETPLVAGCGLLVTAVLLLLSRRFDHGTRELSGLTPPVALAVGLFQALAVLPGISRSGSTITGGMFTGLRREVATNFSFFIAVPAIGGAAVLLLKDLLQESAATPRVGEMLLGGAVACVVGVLALKWLIRVVSQRKLHWFAWYCAAAGLATIGWQVFGRAT